jgi:hypothetical protein
MTDDFFSSYDNDANVSSSSEENVNTSSDSSYAEEIFSEKIEAKNRTYFIDLKQSVYGKFLKVSERSRGRRNTLMIDAEHIPAFIEALTKANNLIQE